MTGGVRGLLRDKTAVNSTVLINFPFENPFDQENKSNPITVAVMVTKKDMMLHTDSMFDMKELKKWAGDEIWFSRDTSFRAQIQRLVMACASSKSSAANTVSLG